jgi:acetyl-CoA acyltransferase
MGDTAENVARKYEISRADQEAFAVVSHNRAAQAVKSGGLAAEVMPITDGARIVSADGCIRPDTNAQALSELKPAFSADGSVTAGTSSPLTDGAAAVLVCTAAYAAKNNLTPLARIAGIAVNGCARPLPPRRSPASANSACRPTSSISMAALWRSAIRWARPARASSARRPR